MIMQIKSRFPIDDFVAGCPIGKNRFFKIRSNFDGNGYNSNFRIYKMELEPKSIVM